MGRILVFTLAGWASLGAVIFSVYAQDGETPQQNPPATVVAPSAPTAGGEGPVAAPDQPAADSQAAPDGVRKATSPKAKSGTTAHSFKLQLTYSEKVLVPRGSKIEVSVHDASGKPVASIKTKTKHDAPPYVLEIPVRSAPTYPLKVDAELTSRIGHRFTESTEIEADATQNQTPVEIHLQKQ